MKVAIAVWVVLEDALGLAVDQEASWWMMVVSKRSLVRVIRRGVSWGWEGSWSEMRVRKFVRME